MRTTWPRLATVVGEPNAMSLMPLPFVVAVDVLLVIVLLEYSRSRSFH